MFELTINQNSRNGVSHIWFRYIWRAQNVKKPIFIVWLLNFFETSSNETFIIEKEDNVA